MKFRDQNRRQRRLVIVGASLISLSLVVQASLSTVQAERPLGPRGRTAAVETFQMPSLGEAAVSPEVLPEEVVRLTEGVFRLDVYRGPLGLSYGTAFAVKVVGRKVYLVTNAHVVEPASYAAPVPIYVPAGTSDAPVQTTNAPQGIIEGGEVPATSNGTTNPIQELPLSFKAVRRGDGPSYEVSRVTVHPQRRDKTGPDVAVVEIEIPRMHSLPPTFSLLPDNNLEPLQGKAAYVLGFPYVGHSELDPDSPFIGRGMISHVDKTRRLITYDSAAGPGSSGSPVFLLKTEHLPGRPARQSAVVVGVHSCSSFLTKLACGVHVRLIAETLRLAQATPTPIIEHNEPTILPISNQGIARRSDAQSDRRQQVRASIQVRALSEIRELARDGQTLRALHELEKVIQFNEESGEEISKEHRVLQAKLLIDFGAQLGSGSEIRQFTHKIDGEEPLRFSGSAMAQFTKARQILETLNPSNAQDNGLYLLSLRAAANQGRIQKDERQDRTTLESTHRALHDLLRNERLSPLNQARCYQLLGFAHFGLDSTPAGRAQSLKDFATSSRLSPSRQSDEWLMSLQGFTVGRINKPDLWSVSDDPTPPVLNARLR